VNDQINHYGREAQKHWQTWLPHRYTELEDPDTFFTELGLRVQDQITDQTQLLAGDDPGTESYLEKVGRLNSARTRAEEVVLQRMGLPRSMNLTSIERELYNTDQAWQRDQP